MLRVAFALFLSVCLMSACQTGQNALPTLNEASPAPLVSASPTQNNEAPKPDESNTEIAEESTEKSIVSLDLSQIPDQLQPGDKALELKAEVVYSDDSRDAALSFTVEDSSVLRKEGNFVVPLKTGSTTITFFAKRDPKIKEEIIIYVGSVPTDSSEQNASNTSNTTSNTNSPTSPASTAGTAQNEVAALSSYFLDYKVGQKWSYQLLIASLAVAVSGSQQYPDPVQLGWGFLLPGMNEGNGAEKIVDYLKANHDLGTYSIEVLEVGEQEVKLKTELISTTPNIPSQAAQIKTYTPDTIGDVYTGILQQASTSQRSLAKTANAEEIISTHISPAATFTTQLFEGKTALNDGLHDSETLRLWMDPEIGMVRHQVNQNGFRNNYLSVDLTLMFKIRSLEGIEVKQLPPADPLTQEQLEALLNESLNS